MREILGLLHSSMSYEDSPPWTCRCLHELVRRRSGVADPYVEMKRLYNGIALELLPELKAAVEASPDRFEAAARIAIAGNIIDPGVVKGLDEAKLRQTLDQALHVPLAVNDLEALRAAAQNAKRILYLGDNCGEVVLDRLLLEELPLQRVTFAVRGRPTLNDALRQDAEEVGISRLVRVIDNGSDVPGTVLSHCNAEFRQEFESADLVISKGQGNYETLSEVEHPGLFFLLKAKCAVVVRELGVELNGVVIKHHKGPGGR